MADKPLSEHTEVSLMTDTVRRYFHGLGGYRIEYWTKGQDTLTYYEAPRCYYATWIATGLTSVSTE